MKIKWKKQVMLIRPYLNDAVKTLPSKKAAFTMAGGILTLFCSFGYLLLGLFFVIGFAVGPSLNSIEQPNNPPDYSILFIGMLGLFSSFFGLVSGIMAMTMRRFALAVFGPSLMAIEALVVTLRISAQGIFSVFGQYFILLLLLSILALLFIIMAKQAFH